MWTSVPTNKFSWALYLLTWYNFHWRTGYKDNCMQYIDGGIFIKGYTIIFEVLSMKSGRMANFGNKLEFNSIQLFILHWVIIK